MFKTNLSYIVRVFFAYTFITISILNCTNLNAEIRNLEAINFPTSGEPEAQEHFIKGIWLLHNFDYNGAEEEFLKAQDLDPDFVMAYWGEAMTYNYPLWFRQDKDEALMALGFIDSEAKKRVKKAVTPLEKDLMRAVNILFGDLRKNLRDITYSNFMGVLYKKYPENHEVACFYALSLMGTSHGRRHTPTYLKAGKILKKVLEENPDHPGALLYTLYAYDEPGLSHLALDAADAYAKLAPPSSHALHMPSHIFIASGMWDKVIKSNEASWQAREKIFETGELNHEDRAYHSLLWLTYGYLQQGRIEKARELIEIIQDDVAYHTSDRAKMNFNAMRGAYLVHVKKWHDPLANYKVNVSSLGPVFQATGYYIEGRAAIEGGEFDKAEKLIKKIRNKQKKSQIVDVIDDIASIPPEYAKKVEESMVIKIFEKELMASLMMEKRKYHAAELLIKEAIGLEEKLPFRFGPPTLIKPPYELYGDFLLLNNKPQAALEAYEKVFERSPRRTLAIQGVLESAAQLKNYDKIEEANRALNAITMYE
ncbi:hypothetical protein QQ020_16100 [Fulvivirgaceae bacterium BMA12]|uniref:Tetratricopeptide repeat protein n=1 Tax=Agaribacillus aureus TaxID=3051825 RepID=A0ABT8L769_9BACT|nr:hypothetical protein [Fulvivirgaceae bacterium BMA12]